MVDAILSTAVERFSDALIENATSLYRVKDDVETLEKHLKRFQCLLKDAETGKHEGASIQHFVAEIREIAYDIEDIIETYDLKVASKRGGGTQNVLRRLSSFCTSFFTKVKTRRLLMSEIARIKNGISDLRGSLPSSTAIKELIDGAGASSSNKKLRERRQTYAYVEHDVFGLEDSLNELVHCLTKEKHKKVVSICGECGLGKTTLARKVYHEQQVKRHFDCRAWVCISQLYQRRDVWQGVMIDLISPSKQERDKIRNMSDAQLVEKLYEILRQKQCLVVLDDIWNVEDWDCLQAAFPMDEDTNSRILLTSRNEDLALHEEDPRGHLHKLKFLNDENSWELLQNLAISWRKDSKITEDLKSLGKEMVGYCNGLRLAIIVRGGLLTTKLTLEEWNQVHENVKSYLHPQEGLRIRDVLDLSYNDLPTRLKLCFLYIGQFPKDFEIQIEDNEETLEDVGRQYLHELVERCMVEVGQKSSVAMIKTCRLHNLMRDFCVQTAKSDNFLHVINTNNKSMEEIEAPSGEVRRIAISGGSYPVTDDPVTDGFILPKYFRLRSLLVFSVPLKERSMLSKFKYLRVVKFVNISNRRYRGLDFLSHGTESLIHLRFLTLRNTGIESIPSLENLKCLHTLDLRSVNGIVGVPNIMFRHMERLRHLYLPRYSVVSGKLQLVNLSKLQTLVNVPDFICDFKDPKNGFDELGKNLMPSNFTFKCLRVLKIIQNMMDKRVDIIPIVTSCPNLYKLRLWGKIEKLPDTIFPHLALLTLYLTYLEEDPMPTLEKFPNLKTLHLHWNAYEGKKMVCSKGGFLQLQSLILSDLYNLEEWEVEEGCMPNLSRLMIHGCKKLIMSFSDGLQFVTTLQKMEIIVMTNPFEDMVGEGEQDSYKIRRVPSLEFKDYTQGNIAKTKVIITSSVNII
ncbi:hypothetical protein I3843_01G040800 [Carya illinoinensis]|nr:hypothetical protein I3843_01G040800 [Carya illinoinensis]